MSVLRIKVSETLPKLGMNIKIQRDILSFQDRPQPFILQKCFISLIIFTFTECIFTDIFQPVSPRRHQKDLFMCRVRPVFQNIPSGKAGYNHFFLIITKIFLYDLLLRF